MLNLSGYTSNIDLASLCAIEPSFGDGAFLIPMVQRLVDSAKAHNHLPGEIQDSLRAYEISPTCVNKTKEALKKLLLDNDFTESEAIGCVDAWVCEKDFLLDEGDIKADFVIGNPPYIRSNDIETTKKTAYLKASFTMTPGSDLFVGFYEMGLRRLKRNGALVFICADRWMHNSYGKNLREYISTVFAVDTIIVMHEVDAFEQEVSAYPAITMIKRIPQGRVYYAKTDACFSENDAQSFLDWRNGRNASVSNCEASVLESWFTGKALWPLASPKQLRLLKHLESRYPSLEDWSTGTKVGIGVATGSDSVFIVSDPHVVESDRVIPIITSRQLNRKTAKTEPLWLVNPWDESEELVDIERYPLMKSYFESNTEKLTKRQVARKSKPGAWFRTIDKVHPGLDKKQKLLIQDMHSRFEPFFDDSHYPHGNLYYVVSDKWDLEVLGGLLMSRICEMFIDAYGVKMRGGTLRFQAQYLRTIRVPDVETISGKTKEKLRQAFRTKDYDLANEAAGEAYQLEDCYEW